MKPTTRIWHRNGSWIAAGEGVMGRGESPVSAYEAWNRALRGKHPAPRQIVLRDEQTGERMEKAKGF